MSVWLIFETKTKDNQKNIHKEWYIFHPVVVYDFVNDAFFKIQSNQSKIDIYKNLFTNGKYTARLWTWTGKFFVTLLLVRNISD